ncbi:F-box protein [Camellia lanceoleosa]|uniref:F-box protein n=1 Tax=Camellia lanceoleosa TaxID=1840588 RepID=A0ACC0GPZ7_9ERIC|nr:F-box protein [Camellia lanceoleosa]
MSSVRPDLTTKVYPEPYTSSSSDEIDHFDLLPDSILLLIFNKIGDVKALSLRRRCFFRLWILQQVSRSFLEPVSVHFGGTVKPLQALGGEVDVVEVGVGADDALDGGERGVIQGRPETGSDLTFSNCETIRIFFASLIDINVLSIEPNGTDCQGAGELSPSSRRQLPVRFIDLSFSFNSSSKGIERKSENFATWFMTCC